MFVSSRRGGLLMCSSVFYFAFAGDSLGFGGFTWYGTEVGRGGPHLHRLPAASPVELSLEAGLGVDQACKVWSHRCAEASTHRPAAMWLQSQASYKLRS